VDIEEKVVSTRDRIDAFVSIEWRLNALPTMNASPSRDTPTSEANQGSTLQQLGRELLSVMDSAKKRIGAVASTNAAGSRPEQRSTDSAGGQTHQAAGLSNVTPSHATNNQRGVDGTAGARQLVAAVGSTDKEQHHGGDNDEEEEQQDEFDGRIDGDDEQDEDDGDENASLSDFPGDWRLVKRYA